MKKSILITVLCLVFVMIFATATASAAGKQNKVLGLSMSLDINPVAQKAYKNSAGNFKIKIVPSWNSDTKYKKLTDEGWKFTFAVKDEDNNVIDKDIDFNKGYTATVKSSASQFRIVATATKENQKKQVVNSPFTGKYTFLAAPLDVTAKCPKSDNKLTLTWNKKSKASGYYIYRSTKNKIPAKPYKHISNRNTTKLVESNLPGKKTYYYWVKAAYKGTANGNSYVTVSKTSDVDSALVYRYLTLKKIRSITWHSTVKKTASLYTTKKGNKTRGKLKKGTYVVVTKKYPKSIPITTLPKRIYVKQIVKGKVVAKGWVKWGNMGRVKGTVSYNAKKKQYTDWSKARKERYVNKKGYSSSSRYMVWINEYTQRINIFKGRKRHWRLYKSVRCTTGRFIQPLINGKFKIHGHQKKRVRWNIQKKFYYYYTHLSFFHKMNSMHSICWLVENNKPISVVRRDCQPTTKGCVRTNLKTAKWIYKHLPLGTTVVVY